MLYEYVNTVGDLAPSEMDSSLEDTTPPSIPLPAGEGWLLDTMTVGKRVMYYTWRRLKNLKTNFQGGATNFAVNATAGSVTTHDISWDIDVSLFAFHFGIEDAHKNDKLDCLIAPDLDLEVIVGAGVTGQRVITSDVTSGDTVINVSPYVIGLLDEGYYLTLKDDLGQESDMSIITSIDDQALTVTLKDAVVNNYSASNNMTMLRNIKMGLDYKIGQKGTFHLGDIVKNQDINGGDGAQIPAGTIVRILYTNTDGGAKNFGFGWQLNYGKKR